MKDILSKLFGFFKYILLIVSFGLVLYGIMMTYSRLEKPLTDAVSVFLPFVVVLVMFLISLIVGSSKVNNNLLFNFVSCFVFITIIVVCLRSLFDDKMILFYKYQMNFNPAFFADNLSIIEVMLYMIGSANALLLLSQFTSKVKKSSNVKAAYSNKVEE